MLSRRGFLELGAALTAAAASWGAWRIFRTAEPPAPPALPDAPPGPLGASTMAALLAAAEAAIGFPIERAHYEEYFRWRAAHLHGYRALYRRFEVVVDRDAHRLAGCAYAACTAALRRRILDHSSRAGRPKTAWDRLRVGLAGRDWLLYEQYVLGEALALFARTDAWVVLGYDAWPGTPRGLDRYRRPPG